MKKDEIEWVKTFTSNTLNKIYLLKRINSYYKERIINLKMQKINIGITVQESRAQ